MGITAKTPTSVTLATGEQWVIEVETRDLDGYLTDADPTIVVTLPNGSTASPTVEEVTAGRYRATYTPAVTGRFLARAATSDDAVDFNAYVSGTTNNAGMPVLADAKTYLGTGEHSWDDAEIQDALDAEAAAQRAVCRVGAVYPADLRQALLRRVQRNLAMRRLPLGVQQGDAEAGGGVLPGKDPEVRRLEAPHRKLRFG